MRYLTILKDQR